MLRKTILGAVMLSAAMVAPAAAQYVEVGAVARHQMLVQVQTMPGAAEAARPWIAEEQRVRLIGAEPRRPRFSVRSRRN